MLWGAPIQKQADKGIHNPDQELRLPNMVILNRMPDLLRPMYRNMEVVRLLAQDLKHNVVRKTKKDDLNLTSPPFLKYHQFMYLRHLPPLRPPLLRSTYSLL